MVFHKPQSQIRRIIEDGRAKGVRDSDVLAYAKISAHSGLDIVFDKTVNYRGVNEQGEDIYADGFYSASRNTIFVNPEASRTQERLLIHELDHAIRKAYGNSKFGIRDSKFESTKKEIEEKYDKKDHNSEFFAHYSEKMLTNKHTLEKLIEAEPTLKEKILSFFKGASTDYADVPKLSGAAKKYYRTYKKLFDEFSARNVESNTLSNSEFVIRNSKLNVDITSENAKKKSLTSINQGNMQVSDRQYALSSTFTKELQDWFDTTTEEDRATSGKRFLVGTTSAVLKSIGVKEGDIYFGGSKINKILKNNESMTLDIIMQAVNLIEDPILVMKSKTVEDSLVLFGEVYTTGGKPVMLSLLYNPKNGNGEILDYSVITSAYGRNTNNLQNLINSSKIYYVNEQKNRTDTWLKALGLQLPSALTKLGSINSIPQPAEKSNSSSEKSLENSSDKQFALPIEDYYANGEEFATPTINTVGKERMTYKEKAFSKDWLFTKKTSAYIHAVDEMFGIQVYLEKVGGIKNAKASIQSVRSAPHQAQTMIGSVQYDIFKGNAKSAKKAGEGLNEIFRPIEKQGEKVTVARGLPYRRGKSNLTVGELRKVIAELP